jgi:ubiquinone/menaquinone biosynthesis C-methylase UbiE
MTLQEIAGLLQQPLYELSELMGDPSARGIFVAGDIGEDTIAKYIHAQFREQAAEYAEAYRDYSHFENLLKRSFAYLGFKRFAEPLTILDIGSGAGNSVIPLLRLFPTATVLASDLSVELLAILKHELDHLGLSSRCALLQLNAETLELKPGSVDVAVGASILHHLLSPQETIVRCAQILRPRGVAVFFEPFEPGNAFVRLIIEAILRDARAETLATDVREQLQVVAEDIRVRTEPEGSMRMAFLDDKWLLNRTALEQQAAEAGFRTCRVFNLVDIERPFTGKIGTVLKLSLGKPPEALPPWAWETVTALEDHFTVLGRQDLVMEGGILLQK